MSSNSKTTQSTLRSLGADMRDRVNSIASKAREEAVGLKESVIDNVERQYENASDGLSKIGKKATRYCRRHPGRTVAAALTVGFLIGRLGRGLGSRRYAGIS